MQINTITLTGGTKARAKDVNDNINILKNAIYSLEETVNEYKQALEEIKKKPTREMFDIYFSLDGNAPTGAYPLWTGEWISHCSSIYPDFWTELGKRIQNNAIQAITEEEYEEALEEFGQCASFVYDELNDRVRLPKITRFISSIEEITDLASIENDAMQNITGKFGGTICGDPEGAFETETDFVGGIRTGGYQGRYYHFDASLQVRTADETRPKNVRLALFLQVANNTGEIASMNTQLIAEELSSSLNSLKEAETTALTAIQTATDEALKRLESTSSLSDIQEALETINGSF